MHVLIIASWYKKNANEINAPFIEEQARMLMHSGLKMGVFYPYFTGGFKERLKKNKTVKGYYIDNGLSTWYYGEMSVVPYFRRIIYTHICLHSEKIFLEYLKENGKPDILHAHSVFMGGVVANYLSKKYNIPYVITEHASKLITEFEIQNKSDIRYVKEILKDANKVIFVSHFQANEMIKKYKLPLLQKIIIPNSLNPIFKYYPFPEKINPIIIVITGSLTINKNHQLLFEAIKSLKADGVICFLKIIGNGEEKQFLENFVKKNDLQKYISFLGTLSRQEVYNELKNSHCLISVSKFETFGINIIESLAVGRPVIATHSGGSSEIINSENGILLNSFEIDELADAIKYLMNNYNKYNQQKISEECQKKYSEKLVIDKLIENYKEAIE